MLRTYLWSLFNKLAMDGTVDPSVKKGVKSHTIKPWKEEGRIDKKTYKVNKPDIEHIDKDNVNTEDLTSDSSDDEATKEEKYNQIMNIKQ